MTTIFQLVIFPIFSFRRTLTCVVLLYRFNHSAPGSATQNVHTKQCRRLGTGRLKSRVLRPLLNTGRHKSTRVLKPLLDTGWHKSTRVLRHLLSDIYRATYVQSIEAVTWYGAIQVHQSTEAVTDDGHTLVCQRVHVFVHHLPSDSIREVTSGTLYYIICLNMLRHLYAVMRDTGMYTSVMFVNMETPIEFECNNVIITTTDSVFIIQICSKTWHFY